MKITIATTPTHDALGITAEVSAAIEAEVQKVAATNFASFISDIDALAVTLYACHPSVRTQYIHHPSDVHRLTAEKAESWNRHPETIQSLVRQGYFSDQLRKLLSMAKADALKGAKLVPIFATLLGNPDHYQLDPHLVSDLQKFLASKDYTDGFLLIEQTEDECLIMPSCWRR